MPAADKKPIQNDGIEDKKFMDFKFDVGVFEMNIHIYTILTYVYFCTMYIRIAMIDRKTRMEMEM